MSDPSELMDIARDLRRLQKSSPNSRDELDAWYLDARRFVEKLGDAHPDVSLPQQVWRFLHDADIRVKDQSYALQQNEALSEVIASLEAGFIPASSGITIRLHPRWLGAIGLLLIAAIYWLSR
jgi:hypothetical protein